MGKQKAIELLRWICVVPAAMLGDFVGYYLGGGLGMLAQVLGIVNPPSDDSSGNRLFRYVIWLFPVGMIVVLAGAKTAPRYHLATAFVVGITWMLWTDRIHGFEGPTLIATAVGAGCGTAFVIYEALRKCKDPNRSARSDQ
jgi:hypothetical protein